MEPPSLDPNIDDTKNILPDYLYGEPLLSLEESALPLDLLGDLEFWTFKFLATVDLTLRYLLGDDLISFSY